MWHLPQQVRYLRMWQPRSEIHSGEWADTEWPVPPSVCAGWSGRARRCETHLLISLLNAELRPANGAETCMVKDCRPTLASAFRPVFASRSLVRADAYAATTPHFQHSAWILPIAACLPVHPPPQRREVPRGTAHEAIALL